MNSPNVYYKIQALFGKMHQIEDKNSKMQKMQSSRIKTLEQEREKVLVELEKAKQMKEGPKEEKLGRIKKASEEFALVESQLNSLKAKFGKAKTELNFDFEATKQSLIEDLKDSVQGQGRCLMLIDIRNEELKCSICQITASEDNPIKQVCSNNHLECFYCAKEGFKCMQCDLDKSISNSEKSDKLLKEIKLLEEIVEELDCDINNPAPENTEASHLKAELLEKEREIEDLKRKTKEQLNFSLFEAFRREQESGIKDLIALVKENASNTLLLEDQLISISDSINQFLAKNNQNLENPFEEDENILDVDQSGGKFYKKHCFSSKNNKIIEFEEEDGEIKRAVERQKVLENANFVFWLETFQLCATANIGDRKWKIELFKVNTRKSMINLEYSSKYDTLFKTENAVYLSVNAYPFKFFRMIVKNDRLSVINICNSNLRVRFVDETCNFIVFTTAEKLFVVRKVDFKLQYTIEVNATGLLLQAEIMFFTNSSREAFKIRIGDKKVFQKTKLPKHNESCLFSDKIAVRKEEQLIIYDWNGKVLKTLNYPGEAFVPLFQTLQSTVLTDKNKKVFVLHHNSLILKEYSMSMLNIYSY